MIKVVSNLIDIINFSKIDYDIILRNERSIQF